MSEPITQQDAIVIERIINASIETVWKMWTDSDHFKNWYGPTGFTVPIADMDLQVGGKHLFGMQAPNSNKMMYSSGEYLEIVPNQRLVYTEIYADEDGNPLPPPMEGMPTETQVTVVLEKLGDSTKMTVTHAGIPSSDGARDGWSQAFDKLDTYVASTS